MSVVVNDVDAIVSVIIVEISKKVLSGKAALYVSMLSLKYVDEKLCGIKI